MAPSGRATAPALQALLKDAALAGSWTLDASKSTVGLKSKSMWGLAPVKGVSPRNEWAVRPAPRAPRSASSGPGARAWEKVDRRVRCGRQVLILGRKARQVGLGADNGERALVDRRAVAQIGGALRHCESPGHPHV